MESPAGPAPSRRRFLRLLGAAGPAAVAGCQSTDGRGTEPGGGTPERTDGSKGTSRPTEGWTFDPVEHDKLVGAHYYPWYGPEGSVQDWLRLVPGEPELGEYDSTEEAVVNQHIVWAREHGINWFSTSWQPDSSREAILNDHVLEAELADRMTFSVLYEPIGSAVDSQNPSGTFSLVDGEYLVDFDEPENRETLRDHFQRLQDDYFDRPNYLRIDDRPVVYVYSARNVAGAARRAYAEAKDAIDDDPYLVASVLGGGSRAGTIHKVNQDWMAEFDAASAYAVYNRDVAETGSYDDFVEHVDRVSREWALATEHVGLDFVPDLMPGMDDTLVPGRDRPPIHRDAAGFREMCRIVRDRMDPDLDAVLVTSFNEWPEFTALEPAESYGTTYLEIVEEELAMGVPNYFDPASHPTLQLRFDRTLPAPEEPLYFAMQLGALTLEDDAGDEAVVYDVGVLEDEPYLLEGAFTPNRNPDAPEDSPMRTWRWLGGPTERTTIFLPPPLDEVASGSLHGSAPRFADETIGVDVYFEGQRTDRIVVEPSPATHTFSLTTEG